jgi:hypothetical protein
MDRSPETQLRPYLCRRAKEIHKDDGVLSDDSADALAIARSII